MALYYGDASALAKLILDEPESAALRSFLTDADLVSSELVITEVSRAVRRAAAHDRRLPLARLLERTKELIQAVALLPVDRGLLIAAGSLDEPRLRALDAIHVASAVAASPHEGVVTYDERQAATARLAGLRTIAPGI